MLYGHEAKFTVEDSEMSALSIYIFALNITLLI